MSLAHSRFLRTLHHYESQEALGGRSEGCERCVGHGEFILQKERNDLGLISLIIMVDEHLESGTGDESCSWEAVEERAPPTQDAAALV